MPRIPAFFPQRLRNILRQVYRNRLGVREISKGALDENWIDEYKAFYHKFSYPSAVRVILEDKKRTYRGHLNITPARNITGFSEFYLSPPKELEQDKRSYVTCKSTYSKYGQDEIE